MAEPCPHTLGPDVLVARDVAADSTAFGDMLERAWKGGQKDPRHVDNSLIVDYVLPDYDQLKRGYTRSHDASKGARRSQRY